MPYRSLFLLIAFVFAAAPALAAEGTITVRACVLDTLAGSNAARVAQEAIGDGPVTQMLSDGLIQVRHDADGSAGERITVEFVAN